MNARILALLILVWTAQPIAAQQVLVEAESFPSHGGWKLDTQFIENMGSPYLLAHGLGRPVDDAVTEVEFPETGEYRVFVRTMDWVARWKAPGKPGRFQLLIDGQPLPETFGTEGAEWSWQDGGKVQIKNKKTTLALHDLTGFDGRCDAILFTKGDEPPPNESKILPKWRCQLLGIPEGPIEKGGYDLVVIGGGYSGMGAAISAARMGCKVALIQNRPVLGGNGSSEVRVWSQGLIRRGRYPRIGEIVEEFADKAKKSPGTYEEFEDAKKERIIRAEPNIELFLNHHAFDVKTEGKKITAVDAFDTRSGAQKRFRGQLYVDGTGHGTIGYLAGADWEMTPNGRMGMSNMWAWGEGEKPVAFPQTPWALDLEMKDFPYPRDHHGQWFWESGFDKDAIGGAEAIRDWNLRAVYGAFNAMKNRDGADKHTTAFLTWIAYIGGPRESRRLMGDVVLTQEDIVDKRQFTDGCVPSTWSIDLHYPKKQYAEKFADNPFISVAVHDRRIDRGYGYPVPYRCFYSRNIDNLFMAGRCISVTHQALGTTRVMKTCGMMGEVIGRAASLCVLNDCTPRQVYKEHWDAMVDLLKLPGKARRATVKDEIVIPEDALSLAGPFGPMTGLDPSKLEGIVVDDKQAEQTGSWTVGEGLPGYVGWNYLYAFKDASIRFDLPIAKSGTYEVRIAYQPHENRGNQVPVTISTGEKGRTVRVNMKQKPPLKEGFISLGTFDFTKGEKNFVEITTEGAGGCVHADAVQIVRKD
ncbi:soluble pyridine nucleotide transhydrogenase [Symmachiella dynata]|uniref:Soluble pyridine nucleotide transhydrogenase n=1 Tax=Symmachiella dynata TaxID=2527995 RepID=A0A517ZYI2_9PLAN|nr:FAD-dependent oxidoreductase [Symmachiella dynata]QDU47552.1 soluble pyridine nucleotide transhydrogenase [Symmachiella dynata]